MDRREFLRKSAMLGGAAALGSKAPWMLSAEAHEVPGSTILDHARDEYVDHIVVLMMENRSVDHYLGWLAADDAFLAAGQSRYGAGFGFTADNTQTYTDGDPESPTFGQDIDTFHLTNWNGQENVYRGCGHPDPGHGWVHGRAQMNGGLNDGFLSDASRNDAFAVGYYLPEDIPAYSTYARRFTNFDNYFCSVLTSTFPNREYLHSAQSGGIPNNALPPEVGGEHSHGFSWRNIWDNLQAAGMIPGVDAGYFFVDLPTILLWGERAIPFMQHAEEYFARCASGTLPRVTFIDPGFTTGLRTDDHPYADIRAGQKLVADYVKAFVDSPHWERGAFFITYDEWGGFFDHVAPPTLPDDYAGFVPEGLEGPGFEQAGFRVPTMMLSPYAQPGFVDHRTYDHTSILRFIEWRYLDAPPEGTGPTSTGSPWHLTQRDLHANNIGASLLTDHDPDFDVPLLPEVPITSAPCEGEELEGSFVDGAIHQVVDQVEGQLPNGAAAASSNPELEWHAFEKALHEGFFERMGFDPSPYLSRKVPTL